MRKVIFFTFAVIMASCTNYKKVCIEKDSTIVALKDSLSLLKNEKEELKNALIEKIKECNIKSKEKLIKKLQDSLIFFENIKQKDFDGWIFNPEVMFEKEHHYKVLYQEGSVFHGADDPADFYVYKYRNLQIISEGKVCFEISFLNKDKRDIWVKSSIDNRVPKDSFTCLYYRSLTPEFREFYEKNFLEK